MLSPGKALTMSQAVEKKLQKLFRKWKGNSGLRYWEVQLVFPVCSAGNKWCIKFHLRLD